MGSVRIVNMSTLTDKLASLLAIHFWNGMMSLAYIRAQFGIDIRKKGHTFTVINCEKENEDVPVSE